MRKNCFDLARSRAGARRRAIPRWREAAARHLVQRRGAGPADARHVARALLLRDAAQRPRRRRGAARRWSRDRAAACLIDNRDGLPYVSAQWAVERGDPARAPQRHRASPASATARTSACSASTCCRWPRPAWSASRSPTRRRRSRPGAARRRCSAPTRWRRRFLGARRDPIVIDLALTTVVRGTHHDGDAQGRAHPGGLGARPPRQADHRPEGSDRARQPVPDRRREGRDARADVRADLRFAHRRRHRPRGRFVLLRGGQQAAHRPGFHRHRSRRARRHARSSPSASRPSCARCSRTPRCACPARGASPPRRRARTQGSRVPDDLLAQIEKLCYDVQSSTFSDG